MIGKNLKHCDWGDKKSILILLDHCVCTKGGQLVTISLGIWWDPAPKNIKVDDKLAISSLQNT